MRLGTALAIALTLAGCPKPPTGPAAPEPLPPDELARRVSATYAAWSEEDIASSDCSLYLAACTERFMSKVGVGGGVPVDNPRDVVDELDPTWLPGWAAAPRGREQAATVFRALTFAASMRAHRKVCTSRYEERAAALDALDQRVTKDVAALWGEKNPYVRLGGLVRLREDVKRAAPDYAGPRYTMELALVKGFDEAGRRNLYDAQHQLDDEGSLLRPRLSPEIELALECLKDVPSWQDPETVPATIVKLPFAKGEREELERRVRDARDLERSIAIADVAVPEVSMTRKPEELTAVGRESFGVKLAVRAVAVDDKTGELVVTLVGRGKAERVKFDCKETERPERVGPDGKVQYDTTCKERDEHRTVTLTARLVDRPDVALELDDELTLWGYPEALEPKEKPRPNPGPIPAVDLDIKGTLRVFHVLEIWRRGIVVAEYFP